MKKVALIGYSGHAFVVADSIQAMGFCLSGYYDNMPKEQNPFSLKYLGNEKIADHLKALYEDDHFFFVAIGLNSIRASLMNMLLEKKLNTLVVQHPFASVSAYASVGQGTFIAPACKINALSTIGNGVILNTGSIIEHECSIADYVHIAPGAVLAGNVQVGQHSFVGANAVIREGVTIGENVIIGAGTVVLKDIQDNEKWVGNPGKRIYKNVQ